LSRDKVYNIINKGNLEMQILNIRKEKRRLKETLILQTNAEEIIEEKLSKNWKSR
jgi:hypothetical protein